MQEPGQEDLNADSSRQNDEQKIEEEFVPSSEWSWKMSLEERLKQCQLLEEKFWILVKKAIISLTIQWLFMLRKVDFGNRGFCSALSYDAYSHW